MASEQGRTNDDPTFASGQTPLRVGVMGAGWMGQQHLATLRAVEDVRVVAVCDSNETSLAKAIDGSEIHAYTEWRRVLEEEAIDAVFLCLPPGLHHDPAVTAFELGSHVFLEKPIALTLEDGEAIAAAAEASGRVCAIGYQWRAIDLLDEIRSLTSGQEVGLVIGSSLGPTRAREWFLRQDESGGNLLERGSHHIDLLQVLAGKVVRVHGAEGSVLLAQSEVGQRADISDVVSVILEFASGALGAVHVAWTREGLSDQHRLTMLTTDSFLEVSLHPELRLVGASRGQPVEAVGRRDPYEQTVEQFLQAVRKGDPGLVHCDAQDGLATLEVCLAAQAAIRTQRAVRLEGG